MKRQNSRSNCIIARALSANTSFMYVETNSSSVDVAYDVLTKNHTNLKKITIGIIILKLFYNFAA